MKTLGSLLMCIFLTGCAVHAHVDMGSGADDREAIAEVRQQYLEAMQKGDPFGAVATFDEDIVIMETNKPAYEGMDAAKEWAVKNLTQLHPNMQFATDELELADDWAIERGSFWQGAGKRLWVYRRQDDDSWRIRYMMWSSNGSQ